jgi:subtilisin family serine protease
VLPEAGQGPQVAFTAPGAELAVAAAGRGGYTVARGTSFAAPLVAGLLAAQLPRPDPQLAREAVDTLARSALDLGRPGRDPVFGYGLVAEPLRVAPARVAAR